MSSARHIAPKRAARHQYAQVELCACRECLALAKAHPLDAGQLALIPIEGKPALKQLTKPQRRRNP
jgi:hypothetical protein